MFDAGRSFLPTYPCHSRIFLPLRILQFWLSGLSSFLPIALSLVPVRLHTSSATVVVAVVEYNNAWLTDKAWFTRELVSKARWMQPELGLEVD